MTAQPSETSADATLTKSLPWFVGGMALLCYWSTLSHWISLQSLETVSRISGWSGQAANRPLTILLFTPFRWFPADWLPLALNVVTAVGAALVLMQLARSVAILRLDIVSADPMRQKQGGLGLFSGPWAWLPPVLAALTLGLQTGFWEHATSASGDMLSVLCFAFTFRCVFEFRITSQEKWLFGGAFVYGMGVTDNWMLLGYLPVFIAAVIWVKGFSPFLEWHFFWRLAASGGLGLALYFLVPLSQWVSGTEPIDFWLTLKSYCGAQKNSLWLLRSHAFRLLALTGILPFLLLVVRWRSHSVQLADDTHLGIFFTKFSGHFIHTLFLITSLWIAMNPVFTARQSEISAALLVYYYAWALVTGYGVAYLLIFASVRARKAPARWPVTLALVLLVSLPGILLWKNFTAVHLTSGGALQEFATQLYEDLPTGNSVVLSDEPVPLMLLQAELAKRGRATKSPLLIETRDLPLPQYHARMAREYGSRWARLAVTNQAGYTPPQMIAFLQQLAAHEPVYYLHPSSGLFFEAFAGVPNGWGQKLQSRSAARELTKQEEAKLDVIWKQRWNENLKRRARQFFADQQRVARWDNPEIRMLKLANQPNPTARWLGRIYSKAINAFGVQLQQAGRSEDALEWFQRALQFNPDNVVAYINLAAAERRRSGNTERLPLTWLKENHSRLLAKYQTWPEIIGQNGPVDEATFLLQSGRMYLAAANPQQALECFARSKQLSPAWAAPKLWEAQTLNRLGRFAAAQAITTGLLQAEAEFSAPALAQLLQVHAVALRRSGQTNEAAAFIEGFIARHRDVDRVVSIGADLLALAGDYQAELKWREILWQRDPKRIEWLVKKGHAELRMNNYAAAQETLTVALTQMPTHANARLFRAIAALQAGQLEAAQRDYRELLKNPTHTQRALFGLGGVAWRQHDTNAMIQYYQTFLSNSASASPQADLATQRIKEWQDE